MTTDLASLLDGLLVIAGLVLVITGIVMFIRSKSSTDPSSVEAFGIKLNVTHPSLILVLAGVGLMLAPRLLPELPGKIAVPETKVEATAPPASDPPASIAPPQAAAPSAPDAPPRPASATTTPPAVAAADVPAVVPAVTQRPAAAETASVSRPVSNPVVSKPAPLPAPPARIAVATASSQATPKPKPKPAPKPAPAPGPVASSASPATPATTPTPAVAAAPPAATPKPVRPVIAFAALGLPTNRYFWNGESSASYTNRLNTTLQQSGRDVLRMDSRGLNLGQAAFDDWWDESRQFPRSREFCAASSAPRALLFARVETPFTASQIESAYWPELKLRLFMCANQRIYRQQKTLSPNNNDAWPFATEFNSEVERFMRTYRGDLAE